MSSVDYVQLVTDILKIGFDVEQVEIMGDLRNKTVKLTFWNEPASYCRMKEIIDKAFDHTVAFTYRDNVIVVSLAGLYNLLDEEIHEELYNRRVLKEAVKNGTA